MRRFGVVWLTVASVALSGCFFGGDGQEVAQGIVDRFVQQVNTDTCDEPSGLDDVDDATWTQACHATVQHLADGESLPPSVVDRSDSGEVSIDYRLSLPYRDVNDLTSTLRFTIDGNGLLESDATISSIASDSMAALGDTRILEYNDENVDPIEPDGQAFVEEVQDRLLAGRCDEIKALMVPLSEFPDAGDVAECDAVATLYAVNAPGPANPASWRSTVYSVIDIANVDEAYGLTRAAGEDKWDFYYRVLEAIRPVNRKVELRTDHHEITIEAVLFEGQWYLLDIDILATNFEYEF